MIYELAYWTNWRYEDFFRILRDYVKGRDVHTPELEALSLRLFKFTGDIWDVEQPLLQETCKEAGLKIQLISWIDIQTDQHSSGILNVEDDSDEWYDDDQGEDEMPGLY